MHCRSGLVDSIHYHPDHEGGAELQHDPRPTRPPENVGPVDRQAGNGAVVFHLADSKTCGHKAPPQTNKRRKDVLAEDAEDILPEARAAKSLDGVPAGVPAVWEAGAVVGEAVLDDGAAGPIGGSDDSLEEADDEHGEEGEFGVNDYAGSYAVENVFGVVGGRRWKFF